MPTSAATTTAGKHEALQEAANAGSVIVPRAAPKGEAEETAKAA